MLNENIQIDRNFSQRDVIAYRFSKMFDEQFANEVLNSYTNENWKSRLASDSEDKNHTDLFIRNKNGLYRCDCKTRADGFFTNNNNKTSEPSILTIGEYAYSSGMTDCISFFGPDGDLYICRLDNIRNNIPPYNVRESMGFNYHVQRLYIFKICDLMNNSSTIKIEVPDNVKKFYNEGYKIYYKYRKEFHRLNGLNYHDMLNGVVESFEREIRELIKRYNDFCKRNSNSADLSPVLDENLNEIYSLLF